MSQYTWMWFFETSGSKLASHVTAISSPSRAASTIVMAQPSAGHALATGPEDVAPAAGASAVAPSEGSSLPQAAKAMAEMEVSTTIRWTKPLDTGDSSGRFGGAYTGSHQRSHPPAAPHNL